MKAVFGAIIIAGSFAAPAGANAQGEIDCTAKIIVDADLNRYPQYNISTDTLRNLTEKIDQKHLIQTHIAITDRTDIETAGDWFQETATTCENWRPTPDHSEINSRLLVVVVAPEVHATTIRYGSALAPTLDPVERTIQRNQMNPHFGTAKNNKSDKEAALSYTAGLAAGIENISGALDNPTVITTPRVTAPSENQTVAPTPPAQSENTLNTLPLILAAASIGTAACLGATMLLFIKRREQKKAKLIAYTDANHRSDAAWKQLNYEYEKLEEKLTRIETYCDTETIETIRQQNEELTETHQGLAERIKAHTTPTTTQKYIDATVDRKHLNENISETHARTRDLINTIDHLESEPETAVKKLSAAKQQNETLTNEIETSKNNYNLNQLDRRNEHYQHLINATEEAISLKKHKIALDALDLLIEKIDSDTAATRSIKELAITCQERIDDLEITLTEARQFIRKADTSNKELTANYRKEVFNNINATDDEIVALIHTQLTQLEITQTLAAEALRNRNPIESKRLLDICFDIAYDVDSRSDSITNRSETLRNNTGTEPQTAQKITNGTQELQTFINNNNDELDRSYTRTITQLHNILADTRNTLSSNPQTRSEALQLTRTITRTLEEGQAHHITEQRRVKELHNNSNPATKQSESYTSRARWSSSGIDDLSRELKKIDTTIDLTKQLVLLKSIRTRADDIEYAVEQKIRFRNTPVDNGQFHNVLHGGSNTSFGSPFGKAAKNKNYGNTFFSGGSTGNRKTNDSEQ